MLQASIPPKFPIPFANSAVASNIQQIPASSQIGITAGAASLPDGFPPTCFLPIGGGGTPPWGRDFNGLLNQVTKWTQWQNAGGTTTFDSTFAAQVGGYPQGAIISSASSGVFWLSLQDNNLSNPDTTLGNPGWVGFAFIPAVQNSSYISAIDTGTADNYVAMPTPLIPGLQEFQRFQIKIANGNLTKTPTLNIIGQSGALGAKTIINMNGVALSVGQLTPGMIASFIYDGNFFQLQNINITQPTIPGTPLRKLYIAGSGQLMPPLQAVTITCLNSIVESTLGTSTWDGTNLRIGPGEDGLWSVQFNLQLGNPQGTQDPIAADTWIRKQSNGFMWPIGESGISSQPVTTTIFDAQVGDVFQLVVYVFPEMFVQPGAEAIFYRVSGVSFPAGYTG